MPFTRIAGFAGFAFVGLLIGVNVLFGATGRPMEAGAPVEDVMSWFADSRVVVDLVTATAPLIWIGMTVFAVGVLMATRTPNESFDPWAIVGIVGVAMQHAIFSGVIGSDAVLAARDGDGAALQQLLHQLHHAPFSLNNASIAIALGGLGAAALRSALAPRWLQWVVPVGVVGLLANAMQTSLLLRGEGFFLLGLVGFIGWAVFVLAVSTRLITRPGHD